MTMFSLARTTALAGFALAAAGAAHADIFMKVSGAPGDATNKGFEQQISLSGASLNINSTLDYGPNGDATPQHQVSVGPIVLNKSPDRSSPKLMLSAINGEELGTVEIAFTSSTRAGSPQSIDSKWILEGAEVRSFQVYPGGDKSLPPVETIEIAYKTMRYQHYVTDAKGVRTGQMEEVKWQAPNDPLAFNDAGCR